MKAHPAAAMFPMLPDEELRKLADDIKAHGLKHSIIVYQKKILDGRNRHRACEMAGVEPRFEEWGGGDSPTAFVVSVNLHRRHLAAPQRAAIAADLVPLFEAEARERMAEAGAKGGKVGGRGNKKKGGVEVTPPFSPERDESKRAVAQAAQAAQADAP